MARRVSTPCTATSPCPGHTVLPLEPQMVATCLAWATVAPGLCLSPCYCPSFCPQLCLKSLSFSVLKILIKYT